MVVFHFVFVEIPGKIVLHVEYNLKSSYYVTVLL